MNDLCATCHAKLAPLSLSFLPGESFFDHYDLVTLEHADFYPDGRDLGENYTYTSWLMSPCVRSGKLDCNHCHTPSGRMRFEGDQSNQSCMPCHEKHVANPAAHGHHKEPKNNACVACHMPMTRFAAMNRSDHSMRPPTPATTLAFGSPNACNLCHTDKDAAWADAWVRTWYPRDYQAEVVRRAELIDAARKRRWSRLPEMLADLDKPDVDAVYKASLVRLLHDCDQESPWPVIARMLKDPSPLVRASAASTLGARLTPDVVRALLGATADASRLVRIRAAASLAAVAPEAVPSDRDRRSLAKAIEEFQAAMTARPDDWSSYANLGNFHMERRDFQKAVENYEISHRLEPRTVGPMVNAAIAYSNLGRNDRAEVCLRRALGHEPANAAANFNLGLLLGEAGRLDEAQQALRLALKSDPQMAAAAYNLGVLLSKKDLQEAVAWCRKAYRLRPDDPKYAHTLAFYLRQQGDVDAAVDVLRRAIQGAELHLDSALLLAEIHESRGDAKAAADVYRQALSKTPLPAALRREMEARIRAAESGRREPKE
jgi:tetratricopeptide (TPR) repeat protein